MGASRLSTSVTDKRNVWPTPKAANNKDDNFGAPSRGGRQMNNTLRQPVSRLLDTMDSRGDIRLALHAGAGLETFLQVSQATDIHSAKSSDQCDLLCAFVMIWTHRSCLCPSGGVPKDLGSKVRQPAGQCPNGRLCFLLLFSFVMSTCHQMEKKF